MDKTANEVDLRMKIKKKQTTKKLRRSDKAIDKYNTATVDNFISLGTQLTCNFSGSKKIRKLIKFANKAIYSGFVIWKVRCIHRSTKLNAYKSIISPYLL